MNKQLFYTGGDPLYVDDFEFMQDALREAITALATLPSGGDTETYIISGCGVTFGASAVVTAGYIVFKGEVCKVDAHSVTGGTAGNTRWDLDISYDADGDQIFGDALTKQTQEIRKVKLKLIASAPDGIAYNSVKVLRDKIGEKLTSAWTVIAYAAGYADYSGSFEGVAVQIDYVSKRVFFRGMMKETSPLSRTTDFKIGDLPDASFRPAFDRYIVAAPMGSNFVSATPVVVIWVKADGEIWIKAGSPPAVATNQLCFQGISYEL